jgi:hypothetical protein
MYDLLGNLKNLLSSSIKNKNTKIKIYRAIILPVVFMGVKLGRSYFGRNEG